MQRKNIPNDYELATWDKVRFHSLLLSTSSSVSRPFVRSLVVRGLSCAAKLHLDLGIGSAIDADLEVVSALTEKLYGDLRRNFFDGFLHFLGGTR